MTEGFTRNSKYWNKLKERLTKEGSQSVTNCHRLRLEAADGKGYLTDVANAWRTAWVARLLRPVSTAVGLAMTGDRKGQLFLTILLTPPKWSRSAA